MNRKQYYEQMKLKTNDNILLDNLMKEYDNKNLESDNIFQVSPVKDINDEVEKLFKYYRKTGFPNYDKSKYNAEKELNKIISFDESIIFNDKDLGQTMHGLGFLWTFFPHWVNIKYKTDKKSLIDNWNNDEKLRTLILKTYKWQLKFGNGVFTTNRIRQNAKVYCSKQSVSNFRPTVAKYLYNNFGNSGTVWDMSAGWGGRLLGFLASNCKKYIGTEPAIETYNGLYELKETYNYVNKDVELSSSGSESYLPKKDSLDLCFTSPPYFDTEEYSQEDTQSFKKFPQKELWIEGFLNETISRCNYGLKDNGHMIINIANTKDCDWLESETIKLAKDNGFSHIDTYYLVLSSIAGKGIKREPIFIFKKKENKK